MFASFTRVESDQINTTLSSIRQNASCSASWCHLLKPAEIRGAFVILQHVSSSMCRSLVFFINQSRPLSRAALARVNFLHFDLVPWGACSMTTKSSLLVMLAAEIRSISRHPISVISSRWSMHPQRNVVLAFHKLLRDVSSLDMQPSKCKMRLIRSMQTHLSGNTRSSLLHRPPTLTREAILDLVSFSKLAWKVRNRPRSLCTWYRLGVTQREA